MEKMNPQDTSETTTKSETPKRTFQMISKKYCPKKCGIYCKKHQKKIFIGVIVLAVLALIFWYRGLFVAVSIDGSPISRLSVIRELEKTSGSQALDILITKKLINTATLKQGIVVSQTDVDTEIKKLETEISSQGATLEMALAQQGITQEQLEEQMFLQKKLEKILGDAVNVSDEELDQYLAKNSGLIPADSDTEEMRNQMREQLKRQKFNTEADKWLAHQKQNADIRYYVEYGNSDTMPPVSMQNETESAPVQP
ncbi:MAG: hypothetical protein ACSLEX_01575 [Minisyncoccota bacterium]